MESSLADEIETAGILGIYISFKKIKFMQNNSLYQVYRLSTFAGRIRIMGKGAKGQKPMGNRSSREIRTMEEFWRSRSASHRRGMRKWDLLEQGSSGEIECRKEQHASP